MEYSDETEIFNNMKFRQWISFLGLKRSKIIKINGNGQIKDIILKKKKLNVCTVI